jgi:hypothetical protein
LQVAVSELETIALTLPMATFSQLLLFLPLSRLLNSFRFLLKPGGDDSIGTWRGPRLIFQCKLGQFLQDVQALIQAFRDARYTARSLASSQVQHGPNA